MTTNHCASERIKKAIMQRICDGVYLPGQRLVELQIAREFATSQAPIREALSELEAMRIVESVPYKGTRVREISRAEIEECLELRGVLEQFAASQVGDRLKNSDVLRQKALETVDAAREKDARRYGLANIEFHRTIVAATNNQTLINVWNSLAPEIRMMSGVCAFAEQLTHCADEHMEITDAFADGDNRSAGILLRKHAETVLLLSKSEHN